MWNIRGHRDLRGKAEFDSEIENDAFRGSPRLDVDRVIDGAPFRFAACDILTSTGDLISLVESYVVPLPSEGPDR